MIKRLLNYLRIGSPKVDLLLNTKELEPGEKVTGTFLLKSGWFEQKISRLECDLVRHYSSERPEVIEPVKTVLMSHSFPPNSQKSIAFQYRLPVDLPPSSDQVMYQLKTKLVMTDDIHSFDHDEIVVVNFIKENMG
ncbi:sporulation protein [Sediminibacillus massiliensis]|uniref:sporulation protein n=1 Tax=Sediminibacillus massiliensis TaxID=1926277 RepID=UPI0009886418|nr:sporulation protein [Sediminibacillus massiliensis]